LLLFFRVITIRTMPTVALATRTSFKMILLCKNTISFG